MDFAVSDASFPSTPIALPSFGAVTPEPVMSTLSPGLSDLDVTSEGTSTMTSLLGCVRPLTSIATGIPAGFLIKFETTARNRTLSFLHAAGSPAIVETDTPKIRLMDVGGAAIFAAEETVETVFDTRFLLETIVDVVEIVSNLDVGWLNHDIAKSSGSVIRDIPKRTSRLNTVMRTRLSLLRFFS